MKTKYDDANKAFNPWIWTQTLYANQVWICLTHYKGKYKDIYNLFTPPPPLMCDHVMIWLPPPTHCDQVWSFGLLPPSPISGLEILEPPLSVCVFVGGGGMDPFPYSVTKCLTKLYLTYKHFLWCGIYLLWPNFTFLLVIYDYVIVV